MAKRRNLLLGCGRCGVSYRGHGLSKYCGDCRPIVSGEQRGRLRDVDPLERGWRVFKASVLRGRTSKLVSRNSDLLGFSEDGYRTLAGVCVYCGDSAYGLVRIDLGKPWVLSNCVCACGVCAKAKTGLGHGDFIGVVVKIANHAGGSNGK